MQSAAERELGRLVRAVRYGLAGHDRAVLAGVVLCLAPLPPANLIGLLLTVFNIALLAGGRLERRELPLVALAAAALLGYAVLWWMLLHFAWAYGPNLLAVPREILNWAYGLLHPDGGGAAPQAV